MKVKSFRCPGLFVATVAQGRTVLRGTAHLLWSWKWLGLILFAASLGLGALVWPYDAAWLAAVQAAPGARAATAHQLAWYLGTWGDYPTYNVPLALLAWIYGACTGSRAWRRVAVVCFLGATLAGLFDDCFRLTLGRPRPDAGVKDGFYGIAYTFQGKYQSFPSGHAAAVFGTAMAALVVEAPLGVVTTLFALAVVWARMELNRHHPSDVIVGSVIGIFFGLMTGWGAKVRRPRPRAAG